MSEKPVFYRQQNVRGRKQHTCYECDATIPAGAEHIASSGKWDDAVRTYRTCLLCHELIRKIDASDPFEPTPFGELRHVVAQLDEGLDWPEVQAFRSRAKPLDDENIS